jgi:hypothetical protein
MNKSACFITTIQLMEQFTLGETMQLCELEMTLNRHFYSLFRMKV